MNLVLIEGTFSKAPQERTLRSGATVLSGDLTIRDEGQVTETVPISWFDPPRWTEKLDAGTEVLLSGRVRRRFFRTAGATTSRTDVVVDELVISRQRARSKRLLDRAMDAVSATDDPGRPGS